MKEEGSTIIKNDKDARNSFSIWNEWIRTYCLNFSVRSFHPSTPSDSFRVRSILVINERRPSLEAPKKQRFAKPRLKKVHFLLPKASSTKRGFDSLDPNATYIQNWLNLMILPLSYEMWAFSYRLALGVPSTRSVLCYADVICDSFFLLDMFITLITALPASSGQEEVTAFPGIASHYFSKIFPYQILPCCVYWILTPICAQNFESLCSVDTIDGSTSSFECLIESISWGLLLWWAASLLRFVPRLHRLLALFKNMESNLVPHAHIRSNTQAAFTRSVNDAHRPSLVLSQ